MTAADIQALIAQPRGYRLSESACVTRKGLWTHDDGVLHFFGLGFGDVEYDNDLGYCNHTLQLLKFYVIKGVDPIV